SAADADKVHDAVTRGAQFGSRDLAKDRHVVGVEKPQPMPKRMSEAMAKPNEPRLGELPTPKRAGMINAMPIALT
ncbi:MAG: hypothetical protein ACKOKC_06585, partial [Chthoniobacterales bacterium]